MTPLDFAAAESMAFVGPHLPAGGRARVLEVGCGHGHLAALVAATGCRVTAIDPDDAAAAEARARGVDARTTGLIEFEGGPFDAVVFVRSLHHIHPLDEGVVRAARLLGPGGRIIVDDFDLRAPDEATASWFFGLREIVTAAGLIDPPPSAPVAGETALAAWVREHAGEHEIHPGEALRTALRSVTDPLAAPHFESHPPYLYRYFCARLPSDARGAAIARTIHRAEVELIAAGALRPVGLRFAGVARA